MCNQCPTVGEFFGSIFRCCRCQNVCKPVCPCKPEPKCECKEKRFECVCQEKKEPKPCPKDDGCLNGACGIY